MTDSITPNLGLTLPTVFPGDQWGGKLNANFSAIDLNAGVVTAEFTANTAQFTANAAKNLATVAALLADTTLAYVAGTGKVVVATSEIVEAGGFRYQVAASGASDQHVTTAGGVKLYVQPVSTNTYDAAAWGQTTNLGVIVQNAHDKMGADGGKLIVPSVATYWGWTTATTLTKPMLIEGNTWYGSEIYTEASGIKCISTTKKIDLKNLHFSFYGSARTTAISVEHAATASTHGGSYWENCRFDGGLSNYKSLNANNFVFHACTFSVQGGGKALDLFNTDNVDTGDSMISSCTFSSVGTNIYVSGTAGINVTNCKFNDSTAHVVIDPANNGNIGNFLFSNNSFEGHTDPAIKAASSGTGTITKVVITGNQFSSGAATHIEIGANVTHTTITGNVFNSTNPATGKGIDVTSNSAEGVTITGNSFHQILTAIEGPVGGYAGITLSGNSFADDVTNIFSGEDGIPSSGEAVGSISVDVSEAAAVTSDAVYTDFFAVKGLGVIHLRIYGLIQGAGWVVYNRKAFLRESTLTDIEAGTANGSSLDVQYAVSGGLVNIGLKRSVGVGTAITAIIEIRCEGQITEIKRI